MKQLTDAVPNATSVTLTVTFWRVNDTDDVTVSVPPVLSVNPVAGMLMGVQVIWPPCFPPAVEKAPVYVRPTSLTVLLGQTACNGGLTVMLQMLVVACPVARSVAVPVK